MTENELTAAVLELAGILGYRACHQRPARTAHGWRTAVQGPGSKGYPDCLLVHQKTGRILFIELKVGRNKLSPDQEQWRDLLLFAGARYCLFTDVDWHEGAIEHVLREHAGQVAA